MQARWMDPNAGTFLSIDPVVGDAFDPQSVNAYSYARNNPVSYTDPTGMSVPDCGLGCFQIRPTHTVTFVNDAGDVSTIRVNDDELGVFGRGESIIGVTTDTLELSPSTTGIGPATSGGGLGGSGGSFPSSGGRQKDLVGTPIEIDRGFGDESSNGTNEEPTEVAFKKKLLRKIIEKAIGKKAAKELFGSPPGCGTPDGCDQDGDGIYDWNDHDKDGDGTLDISDPDPSQPNAPRSPEDPLG